MLPVPYASFEKSLGTKIIGCSCEFQGIITSTREDGDFQVSVIDNALEVKDLSEKTRKAVLQRMEPPIVRDVAAGFGILGLTYFITQITSATLDQTIPFLNLSHRKGFATILLVIFIVHCFFSFMRMTAEHPGKTFLTTDQVRPVQDIRKSAAQDPLFILKDHLKCAYFHKGELLELIVQAFNKQDQHTDELKLKCLQNMNPIMSSLSFWMCIRSEIDFLKTMLQQWQTLKMASRGEERRQAFANIPTFNQVQWDKAVEIIKQVSEKAESIKKAAALPQ